MACCLLEDGVACWRARVRRLVACGQNPSACDGSGDEEARPIRPVVGDDEPTGEQGAGDGILHEMGGLNKDEV